MTGIRAEGVVVGVDETHGSRVALAFAIREAARRGSTVAVITAWTLIDEDPASTHDDSHGERGSEHARRRAQQIQDRAVALTLQEVRERPLLSRQVLQGDAGQVLLRTACDADYLVVGSSTHNESIRPASLGSVSDYCVRNATCAVVVVPTPTRTSTSYAAQGARHVSR